MQYRLRKFCSFSIAFFAMAGLMQSARVLGAITANGRTKTCVRHGIGETMRSHSTRWKRHARRSGNQRPLAELSINM